jgi:hypothetical protein
MGGMHSLFLLWSVNQVVSGFVGEHRRRVRMKRLVNSRFGLVS